MTNYKEEYKVMMEDKESFFTLKEIKEEFEKDKNEKYQFGRYTVTNEDIYYIAVRFEITIFTVKILQKSFDWNWYNEVLENRGMVK